MRSGARTLLLLAAVPNAAILRALATGPARQVDLRRAIDASTSRLRAQLEQLRAFDAIEKHRRNSFPGVLEYELTPAGHELLIVADTLEGWLGDAPDGPLSLGDAAATTAIRALAEAWSSAMLHALAAGPPTLGELDRGTTSLSYPAIERRIAVMRDSNQVKRCPRDMRSGRYTPTAWLRLAAEPLLVACRWERRRHPGAAGPVGKQDVEVIEAIGIVS